MAHNGNMFEYSAMQNVWSSNSDGRQSTESINLKPIPVTAPGTQLSGEVSYFFVRPSVGPTTLTNQRVSSSVFQRSPIIIVVWYSFRGRQSWITFIFCLFDAFLAMSIVLKFLMQKQKQTKFSDFFSIDGQCYVGGGLLKDTFFKINFLLYKKSSELDKIFWQRRQLTKF